MRFLRAFNLKQKFCVKFRILLNPESLPDQSIRSYFEVLSKSTANKDRTVKFHLYESEGALYYIIVDPVDSIAKIYRLNNGIYIKINDVSDELIDFDLVKCKLQFDFSKLWE